MQNVGEAYFRGREWNLSSRSASAGDREHQSKRQAAAPSRILMARSVNVPAARLLEAESERSNGNDMAVNAASRPAPPLSIRRKDQVMITTPARQLQRPGRNI